MVCGVIRGDGVRALQVGRTKTNVTPAAKAAVVARQGVEGFGGAAGLSVGSYTVQFTGSGAWGELFFFYQ